MTDATTEVRRLLDERGVEWVEDHDRTCWMAGGTYHSAYVNLSGNLIVTNLTPQQAIDATLGRGECHDTGTFTSWRLFTCSNCRAQIELNAIHSADRKIGGIPLKFCPNCGAKVVEVGE